MKVSRAAGFAISLRLTGHTVAPTIKHLFSGFDVTVFAYGSTGAGKTHTMRGGKSLAERGMIPRLLSGSEYDSRLSCSKSKDEMLMPGFLSVFRRARKVTKESMNGSLVEISLSYMEIYNDRCFDLFETPDKRSLAGLSLRDNGSKAVVVGLIERPCDSLKDFEKLYDQANLNRSTSATKVRSCFGKQSINNAKSSVAERSVIEVTRYSWNKAYGNNRRSNQNQYCISY